MLTLLAALLVGGTLGYLLAGAAGGGGAQSGDEGFYDAYFDRGYHRGWQEGYDRGYGDGREDSPSSPDHALTFDEARAASDRVAVSAAVAVARSYRPSGLYEADAYDCNDMAEELWSRLQGGRGRVLAGGGQHQGGQRGLRRQRSLLGGGVLRGRSHGGGDHPGRRPPAVAGRGDRGANVAAAVGPVAPGKASTPGAEPPSAGLTGGVSAQYAEGFFYGDPASLREDLGARW